MAEISRLPGPVADLWEWQLDGACRDVDESTFFHPEGERGPRRRTRDLAAQAVCARCPVVRRCREHALAVREPYGVWGGLTEDDRVRILAAPSAPSAPSAPAAPSAPSAPADAPTMSAAS